MIRTQPGDTLPEILETTATAQQVSAVLYLNREENYFIQILERLNRSLMAFPVTVIKKLLSILNYLALEHLKCKTSNCLSVCVR